MERRAGIVGNSDGLLDCHSKCQALAEALVPATDVHTLTNPGARLVLPALFAKARDDFAALLESTRTGHTSAAAAVCRALYDTVIDFYYMTSGSKEEQETRVNDLLARITIDQEREVRRRDAILQAFKTGGDIGPHFPSFWREAAVAVLTQAKESEKGSLADRLGQTIAQWVDAGVKAPRYASLPTRLEKIEAEKAEYANFLHAYLRFYSSFSGFAHGSGAMYYLRQVPGAESSMGLSRGRFVEGHDTPLMVGLTVYSQLLGRYNLICGCRLDSQVAHMRSCCHREISRLCGILDKESQLSMEPK